MRAVCWGVKQPLSLVCNDKKNTEGNSHPRWDCAMTPWLTGDNGPDQPHLEPPLPCPHVWELHFSSAQPGELLAGVVPWQQVSCGVFITLLVKGVWVSNCVSGCETLKWNELILLRFEHGAVSEVSSCLCGWGLWYVCAGMRLEVQGVEEHFPHLCIFLFLCHCDQ